MNAIRKPKIYICWSGDNSLAVADKLKSWLRGYFKHVEVFFSPEIRPGLPWVLELLRNLETSDGGIVCLTPENLNSSWILFETGAISQKTGHQLVLPLVIGLDKGELKGPLGCLELLSPNEDDVFKIARAIDNISGEKHRKNIIKLREEFNEYWEADLKPFLEQLHNFSKEKQDTVSGPDTEEIDIDEQISSMSAVEISAAEIRTCLLEYLKSSHPRLKYFTQDRAEKAVKRIVDYGYLDINSFKAALPAASILSKYKTYEVLSLVNMIIILLDEDRYAKKYWLREDNRITEKFRRFLRQDGVDTTKFPESDNVDRAKRLLDANLRAKSTKITEHGLRPIVLDKYKDTKAKLAKDTRSLADVIEELRRVGVSTISGIKRLLDEVNAETSITIRETPFNSIAGLLRYTLIIWDQKLYFTVGWRQDWNPRAQLQHKLDLLRLDGVDINNIPDEDPDVS